MTAARARGALYTNCEDVSGVGRRQWGSGRSNYTRAQGGKRPEMPRPLSRSKFARSPLYRLGNPGFFGGT